jgi:Calcium binding
MPRTHNQSREDRIIYEVIVDCYDEGEQLMGWYYYMADNLEFPIKATVRLGLCGGGREVLPE